MARTLASLAPLSVAALAGGTARAAESAAPELGASVVQMLLGLAVVLLLLFAGLALLKRLAAPRGAGGGSLRVVAATSVGPRERVVMVEVGDTWVMLGVAPGAVRALHTLPRQVLPAAAPSPSQADFAGRLAGLLERARRDRA